MIVYISENLDRKQMVHPNWVIHNNSEMVVFTRASSENQQGTVQCPGQARAGTFPRASLNGQGEEAVTKTGRVRAVCTGPPNRGVAFNRDTLDFG